MASAICPHCNEPAFSSAEFIRPWTCPTCGQLVIPMQSDPKSGCDKETVIDQYTRFWAQTQPDH